MPERSSHIACARSDCTLASQPTRAMLLAQFTPHVTEFIQSTITEVYYCFDTFGWASGRASGLYKLNDEVLVWLSVWSKQSTLQYLTPDRDNHTNTSSLNFYRPGALPGAQPKVSKHWRHNAYLNEQLNN